MQVVIAGHGNLGREIEAWLRIRGFLTMGFLDDEKEGERRISDYERGPDEYVAVGVSDPDGRRLVVERLRQRGACFRGLEWQLNSTGVSVGNGSILLPYSLCSVNATVGEFVIVNVYTSIGHDVIVGDYCTLSSHCDICGHVELGEGVFMGSGARVMPGIKVGAYAKIGAGAVVVKDVPAGATIYTQPGRTL